MALQTKADLELARITGNGTLFDKLCNLVIELRNPYKKEEDIDRLSLVFGKVVYDYFNQPMSHAVFAELSDFHGLLAIQVQKALEPFNVSLRPGMTDSKGWLSAIFEFRNFSLTCLLFEEALGDSDVRKPLRRKLNEDLHWSPHDDSFSNRNWHE